MESKNITKEEVIKDMEIKEEKLEQVSSGTNDAKANLESDYIEDEVMLIIPIT